MDLSLGTETTGSTYLHHHHQQQRQLQQQPFHYLQQHQQHYQHHHPQLPPALSLAPPSGNGFFDLESLEHKGVSNLDSGLGRLGASSSYQPEFALSSFASSGAPDTSFSSAAFQHVIPSHSSGQLWSRNSLNTHSPQVGAAQNLLQTAAGHSFGTHTSLPGWAVTEPHRLQLSQHAGDNCLPPGVEPSMTAGTAFSHGHSKLQGNAQSYPQITSLSSLDLPAYRQLLQQVPSGVAVRTVQPPQKLLPKRRRGWCSVCQRNCVTAVALRQHLEGKGHKKHVERQKLRAELHIAKQPPEEDGGVSNMLEQVWMQVSMMNKVSRIGNSKKKERTEETGKEVQPLNAKPVERTEDAGKEVQPLNATPVAEGDFTIRKRKLKAVKDEQPTAAKPNSGEEPPVQKKKAVEKLRCELCNVECNSQTVLEIHLGGRKHVTRVKNLQETPVASLNSFEGQQT